LLEVPVAQAYARTCASKARLTLKVDDSIAVPYTTKDTLVIPALQLNATEEQVDAFKYGVVHETLHHTEGSRFDYLDTLKKDSPLRECYGIVEDFRIEKIGTEDYDGDRRVINNHNSRTRAKIAKSIHEMKRSSKDFDNGLDKLVGMMTFDWEARAESGFEPSASIDADQVREGIKGTKAEPVVNELFEDEELLKMYRDVRTPEDSIKVAEALYFRLFKEPPSSQKKPGSGGGDGKGEGNKKEGEGKGDGKPINLEEWKRIVGDLGPASRIEHGGYESGSGIQYSGRRKFDAGVYEEYGPNRTQVLTAKDMEGRDGGGGATFKREYAKFSTLTSGHAVGVANALRRILQVRSQAYYINNQKRGKLSAKNAYRLLIPQVGDGEWNMRIFRKKVENDILDAAVTVLVDCSGSMRGPKYINAIDSAIILNSALSQRLHVPVEVLGFTDPARQTYLVAKGFDEKVSDNHIRDMFGSFSHCMANNADGEAIMWAFQRLRTRKEKRKVLIVLSDGSPCGGPGGGNIHEYTKAVVQKIEEDGTVHIVGIGVEDSSVKNYYKRTVIISDSSQLGEKMLEVCKKDLFKVK
jgi:Mg-chelatase subunit ChlD